MAVNTWAVAAGQLIESAWGNTVRQDLLALDTGKVGTTGAWAMSGALTAATLTSTGNINAGNQVVATGNITGANLLSPGAIRSGDNPVAVPNVGAQLTPGQLVVSQTTTGAVNINVIRTNSAAAEQFVRFNRHTTAGSVTTEIGSIAQVGTSGVAYNTASDERLKTDAGAIDFDAIETDLLALTIRRFTWNDDPDLGEQLGLFAQEAYLITPDTVTVGGDDPALNPWSIDNSRYVPRLLAQVQHLTRRVATLEAAA